MRNALSYLIRCLGLYLVSATLACGLNFPSDWFGQPLLSQPLRMDDLDGAMIAKVAREKNSLPLLYPRVVSVFEWMDRGDPEMITLKDLLKNPSLHLLHVKKPVTPTSSNPYSRYARKNKSAHQDMAFESKDFEDRLLLGNRNSLSLPSDDQLQAFLRAGKSSDDSFDHGEIIDRIQRGEYRDSPLKGLWRDRKRLPTPSLSQREEPPSSLSSASTDLDSLTPPEFPATFDASEGVLKLRASKPSGNGKLIPAQASQFYLTTQNLNDLLKGLSSESAIADEVQSVAELWAQAEKNRHSNPEVALSVKSILLQAKVGKALTDPFGHAALENLPPDDKYYLIGIDKDPDTNVVTIWSKEVEVNPGENLVELSPNDVIYQD